MRKKGTVRLLKVNIAKWGSPVSKQFGIRSIPQLWLYRGTSLASKGRGAVMGALR